MSNPEGLINSIGSQEPAILPEEELVEGDDSTLPDDDVSAEARIEGQDAIGGGINTDPDLGIADSPDEVDDDAR
ncbi:hypothetical protein [Microbacterium sp. NPDC087665]|uniref:hypothetical protein n=1 Tax=Microbacterium sp. NPDC087665 TaxID=3364194 RepID=UPI00381F8BBF